MPKSKNVLVAVGAHPAPRLPRQNYIAEDIITRYNFPLGIGGVTQPDADFFNLTIDHGMLKEQCPDIYGFLKGSYSYSSPSSLQQIVDVFNMHDEIEIVTTDVMVHKKASGASFIDYGHSERIPNEPFFVKCSIIEGLRFENSPEIFKKPLEDLVRKGKRIYHIGEPLLTTEISE
jgi:hypothetical protein